MSSRSPYVIELGEEEGRILEERAGRYALPYCDVVRARIVLMASEGMRNDEIAERLSTGREVVSTWRKRFCEDRLPGLERLPRQVRPALLPPQVVVEVKAIACELPKSLGVPFGRLSISDIRSAEEESPRHRHGSAYASNVRPRSSALPGCTSQGEGFARRRRSSNSARIPTVETPPPLG